MKDKDSHQDFEQMLMSAARRIAAAANAGRIGAEELWQAFLHLAHTGHIEARRALDNRFGGREWDGSLPEVPDVSDFPAPLPLADPLKRLLSPPLGRLYKKHGGRLTPHNLIELLDSGKVFRSLGLVPDPDQSGTGVKTTVKAGPERATVKDTPAGDTSSGVPGSRPPAGSSATVRLDRALRTLDTRLENGIFGQTAPLRAFISGLRTSLHRPVRSGSLAGSFLIFGPNGCGKGELIRLLEAWVEEFKNVLPVKSLIHCEGYIHNILPTLREKVRSTEPSIIVLGEFEKYEPVVRDVLMEGLDRAVLQLPDRHLHGKIQSTDIRGSIVIMLGNVGRALWGRLPFKEVEMLPDRERVKEILELEAIESRHHKSGIFEGRISGALLDRVDHIIPFCQLRYADVARIVDRDIGTLTKELAARGVKLAVEPRVRDLIVLSSYYRRAWSGRQALRGCREYVEGPVRDVLLRHEINEIKLVSADRTFNGVVARSRPRVLIIDDQHEEITPDFAGALKDLADVEGCANVARAIEMAGEKPFDLLLLDLYFGDELRWREYLPAWRASYPETPVVLLSGKVVSAADRLEIDRLGGVLGFMAKPLKPDGLPPALAPFLEHADWQAKIRAFENRYGFGGDRVVFDVNRELRGDSVRIVFSAVGVAVAEGTARESEEPILPRETRQEIDEFIDLFLDPRKRAEIRVEQPRGLLLHGPPGNGKTMIARDLARRMRCNFLAMSAGDFVSRWAGVAAERLKELFAQARLRQPCVVFIDEIDAVATRRSSGSGTDLARDQAAAVATLLAEIDGFGGAGNVFLIGATNRREAIDEALLRPGRLDRAIEVPCPRLDQRRELLKRALSRINAADVEVEWAAGETYGFSCAQIVGAVRDSVLVALRRAGAGAGEGAPAGPVRVTRPDFREAVDRLRYGAAVRKDSTEAKLAETAREMTAWHEAGHLVLSLTLLGEVPDRVTIVPRGDLGGYVRTAEEDIIRRAYSRRRSSCLAEIAVMLGGGIAEETRFSEHSTGVSSDRQSAVRMARDMVVRWGMGPIEAQVEGLLNWDQWDRNQGSIINLAGHPPPAVAAAVSEIIGQAEELARAELGRHKKEVARTARLLLEREELDRSDLQREVGHLAMPRDRK